MARSLLGAFVGGTRQMLTAQLLISVSAVGLGGWTLAVTNELIRERERLRERVIQLEQAIAATGEVVPGPITTVERTPTTNDPVYPGAISETPEVVAPEPSDEGDSAIEEANRNNTPEAPAPAQETPGTPAAPTETPDRPDGASEFERGLGRILGELFTPPPAMSVVVLHARNEADAAHARRLAATLAQTASVRFIIEVMPARDPRESGYAYYDGRQSRAAAALVQQFHDAARRQQIGAWSAQLRGTALPASGQYTAERLDIVLPPLPTTGTRGATAIDPRRFQETPAVRVSPPPPPPPPPVR